MAEFRTIDKAVFRNTASATGGPRAISARFDRRRRKLVLRLEGGIDVAFDARRVPGLEAAADDDLAEVTIEGVGSTIRLPRLDADYGVANLLDLFLKSEGTSPRKTDNSSARRSSRMPGKSAA